MIKIEDLKEGQRIIYFKNLRKFGYYISGNWDFDIVVKKILKTKIKTECGKEFKIENGKIDDIYSLSEKESVRRKIIDKYKKELKEEVEESNGFRLIAYKELIEEIFKRYEQGEV